MAIKWRFAYFSLWAVLDAPQNIVFESNKGIFMTLACDQKEI